MTAGSEASRRVLARTPVAPLPASSPTRPTGITGRMSAPPETSSPGVCSFSVATNVRFSVAIDTEHLASDGAKPQVLRWYRRAKATTRGGKDGEESACLIVCAGQRVAQEGSSPSGALMESTVSKSGGNASLAVACGLRGGGQGVHREVESEGYEEQYRAVIEGAIP